MIKKIYITTPINKYYNGSDMIDSVCDCYYAQKAHLLITLILLTLFSIRLQIISWNKMRVIVNITIAIKGNMYRNSKCLRHIDTTTRITKNIHARSGQKVVGRRGEKYQRPMRSRAFTWEQRSCNTRPNRGWSCNLHRIAMGRLQPMLLSAAEWTQILYDALSHSHSVHEHRSEPHSNSHNYSMGGGRESDERAVLAVERRSLAVVESIVFHCFCHGGFWGSTKIAQVFDISDRGNTWVYDTMVQ